MAQDFRLEQINQILERLTLDDIHYTNVRGKYSRVRSIIQKVAIISGALSATLTSSGIGVALTGSGAIIGLPISVVGSIIALLSIGLGVGVKSLSRKITKHDRTIQLIESKRSTISNLLSKALSDDKIDDLEFTLITHEFESYNNLRMEIRRKSISPSGSKTGI